MPGVTDLRLQGMASVPGVTDLRPQNTLRGYGLGAGCD